MKLIKTSRAFVAAAGLFSASLAQGALIGLTTFESDGNDPRYRYVYAYQDIGSSPTTQNLVPAVGVGGTQALRATVDFTGASGGFSGFGLGANVGPGAPDLAPLFTAPINSLSDLVYSVALSVSGTNGLSSSGGLEFKFEVPDNFFSPADANGDADVLLQITTNRDITTSLQTFSGNLGNWTITVGSLALLNTHLASISNVNFNVNYGNGFNDFGNDANNSATMDSVQLDQVPEPASAALLGLALPLLFARRTRKCSSRR